MNKDLPNGGSSLPEERITAYLLGELSETEAAEVAAALQRDPAVQTLADKLKRTIDLVSTTMSSSTASVPQNAPARLSEARREALLAKFQEPTAEPRPPRKFELKIVSWLAPVGLAASILLGLGWTFIKLRSGPMPSRAVALISSQSVNSTSDSDPIADALHSSTPLPGSELAAVEESSQSGKSLSIQGEDKVDPLFDTSPRQAAQSRRFGRDPAASSDAPARRGNQPLARSKSERGRESTRRLAESETLNPPSASPLVLPPPPSAAPASKADARPAVRLEDNSQGSIAMNGPAEEKAGLPLIWTDRFHEQLVESSKRTGGSEDSLRRTPGDRPLADGMGGGSRGYYAVPPARVAGEAVGQKESVPQTTWSFGGVAAAPPAGPQTIDNLAALSIRPSDSVGEARRLSTLTKQTPPGAAAVDAETSVVWNESQPNKLQGLSDIEQQLDGRKDNLPKPAAVALGVELRENDFFGVAGQNQRQPKSSSGLLADVVTAPLSANKPTEPTRPATPERPPLLREPSGFALDRKNYAQKPEEDLPKLLGKEVAEDKQKLAELESKAAAPVPASLTPKPEQLTQANRFSTFSLNVSDVSFKLALASLSKDQLPDRATIRSEEFVNAFNYHDPAPAGSARLAFAWEQAHQPWAHQRDLVRFAIQTAARGREPGRPLNLVLLLDNSGSMERADRVRIVREALRVLLDHLTPADRISVVTFARTARLWIDGWAGDQKEELLRKVGTLNPEGGTNLEEALALAYATAEKHSVQEANNRVILMTDGAANLGNVEPAGLNEMVERFRKRRIALDCFGIGWDGYNDTLLETLSRHGDGRYGFLNQVDDVRAGFAEQLAGSLQVAAADVKAQVEFNPQRVTSYRQIGYDLHQLTQEQFRDNTVDAAEIGAAESGTALYSIQVNRQGSGPLGVVRVRFKVPSTGRYEEQEWILPYLPSVTPFAEASPTIRLAGVAAAFAEWLANSPYAATVNLADLERYLSGIGSSFSHDKRPQDLDFMLTKARSLAGQ